MNEVVSGAGVSVAVAALVMAGCMLTLVGNIGLVRLKSFYDRVHAPTLGSTLGAGLILAGTAAHFMTLTPILIMLFVVVTTPITFIMLVRAALYRDRVKGRADVPKII